MKQRSIITRVGSLLLSVLLVCSLFVGFAPKAMAEETAVLEARSSVVRIVTLIQVSYQHAVLPSTGTGFFVGEKGSDVQTIVTNRHVVDPAIILSEYQQAFSQLQYSSVEAFDVYVLVDGKAYQINYGDNVTLSQIADLAIVKLDEPIPGRAPAVLGAADDVKPTDNVYAIGYPGYSDTDDINNNYANSSSLEGQLVRNYTSGIDNLSVTKGTVVKTQVVNGGISNIQHDANVSGGNSGGPLVTENGSVVGVNSWLYDAGNASAFYAIDVDNVKTLLKQNNIAFVEGTKAPAETVKPTATPKPTAKPTAAPTPAPEPATSSNLPLIIGAVAAVAVIAVLAVVLSKKKKPTPVSEPIGKTVPAAVQPTAPSQKPLVPVVRSMAEQHGGKKVAISGDAILIGRSQDCKIVFKDGTPGVSSRHCALTWDAEKRNFILKDMGSTYGTFLESGMKLEPNKVYRLKPGESFYLGDKANLIKLEVE